MEFIAYKKVTNRKDHKCFACGETKPKGEKMGITTAKEDYIFSTRFCIPCEKFYEVQQKKGFIDDEGIEAGSFMSSDWKEEYVEFKILIVIVLV